MKSVKTGFDYDISSFSWPLYVEAAILDGDQRTGRHLLEALLRWAEYSAQTSDDPNKPYLPLISFIVRV